MMRRTRWTAQLVVGMNRLILTQAMECISSYDLASLVGLIICVSWFADHCKDKVYIEAGVKFPSISDIQCISPVAHPEGGGAQEARQPSTLDRLICKIW